MLNKYKIVKEIWKSCRLAPYYEVSNLGYVRRASMSPSNSTYVGRMCKRHKDKDGYWKVWLVVKGRKNAKPFFVHRLVADAFIGRLPRNEQVNHKDLDKSNARFDNLEYVTPRGNRKHAIKHGVVMGNSKGTSIGCCGIRGIDHFNAKLTPVLVKKIRRNYRKGVSVTRLARRFGVSNPTIDSVLRYKTWAHVA